MLWRFNERDVTMRIDRRAAAFFVLISIASVSSGNSLTYAVGKLGVIRVPAAVDSATSAVGITAGYRLDQRYALELDADSALEGNTGLLPSTWAFGGYVAYRELLTRHLYWKARGGSAFTRYVAQADAEGETHGSLSLGAGAGWVFRLSKKSALVAEAEFTWLGGERSLTSAGVSLPF